MATIDHRVRESATKTGLLNGWRNTLLKRLRDAAVRLLDLETEFAVLEA